MTEIVSFLDLSVFPSVALVFFLAAFLAILWKVLRTPASQSKLEASIPLNDDVVVEPRNAIQTDTTPTDKGATHA
tara:strand:- start:155 stop:379 length:225 start_codon:yes stop_codon:yes gene_type:complete